MKGSGVKKQYFYPLAFMASCAFFPASAQTGGDNQQLFTPLVLTAEQIAARNDTEDPKINPKKRFDSDFDVKGPVSIEYANTDYAKTQGIPYERNSINQLGIVVASQVNGLNVNKRVWAILAVSTGTFRSGAFDDNTKEYTRSERLQHVVNRAKLENPALNDIPKAIDAEVLTIFKTHPELEEYDKDINVIPRYWSLIFDDEKKPETEALYSVQFAALISKPLENGKGGFFRPREAYNIECKYASENKSLTDWQKNDYELIAVERARALDNCIATIKPQMPKLLEIEAK